MKRLASIVMALFLGTSAVVAFTPDSQAIPIREGPYRTRDYRYGERYRGYYPRPRYYRGERRYPRYEGYRYRYPSYRYRPRPYYPKYR